MKLCLVSLFLFLFSGCGATGDDPASPFEPTDPVISSNFDFIDLPVGEQLAAGPHCKEVTLEPDKSTRVNINFAKMEFPEGAVEEATDIVACTDKSIYAIDLEPSETSFLLPVTVQFRLKKKDLTDEQLERISVVLITSDGQTELIPHTMEVKKKEILVFFSIGHFSRYALVMD
ncbi:MAG: hypothetical protein ACE5OP_10445 [Candidatus Glassbacteria bacterium]